MPPTPPGIHLQVKGRGFIVNNSDITTLSMPKKSIWKRIKANSGFLFILPAVVIFLVFGLYTVIYSIFLSFFRWNGFGKFNLLPFRCELPACKFVGLDNFKDFLFREPTYSRFFWWAAQHNLEIAVFVTALTIMIALPLAISLNHARRGQSVYRSLMLLPMITSGIAVYYVWMYIYEPDGLLNTIKLDRAGDPAGKGGLAGAAECRPGIPDRRADLELSAAGDDPLPFGAADDQQRALRSRHHGRRQCLADAMEYHLAAALPDHRHYYHYEHQCCLPGLRDGVSDDVWRSAAHTEVVGLQIFKFGFGDQRALGMASAMSWILFIFVFVVALFNLRILRSRT